MKLVASDVTVVVFKDTGYWVLGERPKETAASARPRRGGWPGMEPGSSSAPTGPQRRGSRCYWTTTVTRRG